jgi:two-component system cell cycle response regulator
VLNPAVEVTELRSQIARLTEEARKNEETWRRSQQRAMLLLEADDLPELFDHLTEGLRRSYGLQAASVALADQEHEIRNLLHGQGRQPREFENVLFVDTISRLIPRLRGRPWLGRYRQATHECLFAPFTRLESVAIIPLVRQTRLIGSLHFGSDDPNRFTESHATDFLHHLASIAAFGLENTVNRARLIQTGFTDALTGWHNRGYLDTRLKEELARSQREQTPTVCLLLDIDHFKSVNDSHGHAAGDTVLCEVARRIEGQIRGSDISARYGGEEFVVLLPNTPLEAGRRLAERIRTAVSAAPFSVANAVKPLTVTVSIGLAEYRPTAGREDPEGAGKRLLAEADVALYEAKAAGRNTIVLAAA